MQTPLHPLIDKWITAFNTHDVATIVSLYMDDAELLDSGMNRPREGRAAIERWFRWRFHSTPITYTPVEQASGEDGQVELMELVELRADGDHAPCLRVHFRSMARAILRYVMA